MRNWKDIPLPENMKDLPKDKRGYSVPFVVLVDTQGNHHFAVNDENKTEWAIKNDLCSICGNVCGEDKWLIGGAKSAFHPRGAYVDIPVHKSCGEYALKVCPYLAVSVNTKRVDLSKLKSKLDKEVIFFDPTQSDERVPFFVFSKIKSYTVTRNGIYRYIIPEKPYLEVEYWNDGAQVDVSQEVLDKYVNS
jgi:hypothetical protein